MGEGERRKPGRPRLSAEEHRSRGTFQPSRHRLVVAPDGDVDEEGWLSGLSGEARLRGIWALQYYKLPPTARQAFRHYCRAYGVEQRVRQRHMAESRRVSAWLWKCSQRVPWQPR